MASFTDAAGRSWEVRITLADLPRLREAGIDVGAAVKDPDQFRVMNDPEVVGRVLWCLCGRQAEGKGLDPEGFAAGFDGPTLFAALDAFTDALTDFSQPPGVAAEMKARAPGVRKAMEARAVRKMDSILAGLIDSAGNSPASPGSTPAP